MRSSLTMFGVTCNWNNLCCRLKSGSTKPAAAICGALTSAALSALLLGASWPAHAQNETVLYSFMGSPDGASPSFMTPVLDTKGNVYGTTFYGGYGYGTVFRVTPSGTETVLHSFHPNGEDGFTPHAGVVRGKKGILYGTTDSGGAYGGGTVFEVTKSGTETILYSFNPNNGTDGFSPYAGVIIDKQGNLYGTTNAGGAYGGGTVFKLTPSGTETILWSFGNGTDGDSPAAGLVMDKNGNLYGTTSFGGAYNYGAVFELTPSGTETILHSFVQNGTDGYYPIDTVVRDKQGNLYGATNQGGAYNLGTVFELTPSGTETILWSFGNGMDGNSPDGGVVLDKKGSLYGTTLYGGTYGHGTVYKLTP